MKKQRDRPSVWGRIWRGMRWLWRTVVPSLAIGVGCGLIVWGVSMIYRPAAFLAAGVMGIVLGVLEIIGDGGEDG